MPGPLALEDFDADVARASGSAAASATGETQKLAAYEDGYRAGWDDAAASQTELQTTVSTELAAHLQDLAFTFHEAKAHVLKSIEPLMKDILGQVLPGVAKAALPGIVAEEMNRLADGAAANPIILSVAPESREALLSVLPEEPGFPLIVRDEPTLAEGQVFLRLGEREVEVDTGRATTEILAAIDDFFTANDERIAANG